MTVCGDRAAPVANGVGGARLKRLARRLTDALEAPRSEVDREAAKLLAQSGGRLTDSMEREIFWKVFASDWSLSQ
jgi:hypothetical protein